MTVRELIERLSEHDPEMDVCLMDYDRMYDLSHLKIRTEDAHQYYDAKTQKHVFESGRKAVILI